MLSAACFAEGENYDTLAGWNIRIAVPEGATPVLQGNEYYLYAQHSGSIPYVMIRTYSYADAEAFLRDLTAYMRTQYADLAVTAEITARTIVGPAAGDEGHYIYSMTSPSGLTVEFDITAEFCQDLEAKLTQEYYLHTFCTDAGCAAAGVSSPMGMGRLFMKIGAFWPPYY